MVRNRSGIPSVDLTIGHPVVQGKAKLWATVNNGNRFLYARWILFVTLTCFFLLSESTRLFFRICESGAKKEIKARRLHVWHAGFKCRFVVLALGYLL